ncbi:MAG: 2OG-Fe(II) oxygenase [Alphaproteobacteria bacterium]|nr:2OG-Fe(II) oxygenase [Alphaproteobacteria bacterium]
MASGVLDGLTAADIRREPFPHVHRVPCLPEADYRALVAELPRYEDVVARSPGGLAPVMHLAGHAITSALPASSPVRAFVEHHQSAAFYRGVIELFGDDIRRLHPGIERVLGKDLAEASVSRRTGGGPADVLIDCQLGFNPPSPRPSRVRGVHIDKRRRLFSGLLYLRYDEDDTEGGDLAVYRFKPGETFSQDIGAGDDQVELVATLPYRPNSLVFFVNSAQSLHAVMPRAPTRWPRRHLNFLAELNSDFIVT